MLVKKIIDAGICIAVVQSYSFLTRGKITTNKQFDIIALSTDSKSLRGLGFEKKGNDENCPVQHRNIEGTISKEMNQQEIADFVSLLNEENSPLVKIIDNTDGKIYEIKGDSFKEKFDNQSKKRKSWQV